jgi:hypothetical protein
MDVTRHDVAKLHHGLRETPYQANRLLAVLSKMFNLAGRWGLRPDDSNPAGGSKSSPSGSASACCSEAELGRLGDALTAHDGSPYVAGAIKLLG